MASGSFKTKFEIKDNGFKSRLASLFKPQPALEIGILGSDAGSSPGKTNETLGEIGAKHEFGAGNVPQRSFLQGWFDENKSDIRKIIRSRFVGVSKGKITKEQALEQAGIKFVAQIKRRIRQNISPPLAKSTKDRKKSSTPLIDKGHLINGISFQFKGKK